MCLKLPNSHLDGCVSLEGGATCHHGSRHVLSDSLLILGLVGAQEQLIHAPSVMIFDT